MTTIEQEYQQANLCDLGRIEYGGDRYCYTHGGFQSMRGGRCNKAASHPKSSTSQKMSDPSDRIDS